MIVSNSSALIILDRIGLLDLLPKLYKKITIPEAVKGEVFKFKSIPAWIKVLEISQPIAFEILEKTLGRGEGEAILRNPHNPATQSRASGRNGGGLISGNGRSN